MGDQLGGDDQRTAEDAQHDTDNPSSGEGRRADEIVAAEAPDRHDDDRSRASARAGQDQHDPGSKAEWAMVHLTEQIVSLNERIYRITTFTAILAILAVSAAGLQWWEMHAAGKQVERQIKIAEQQAVTGGLQASALKLQAQAASDQADAAHTSLKIAKQNVDIAGVQANALVDTDKLQQSISSRQFQNVQLVISGVPPPPYSAKQTFSILSTIINKTPAIITIRRIFAQAGYSPGRPIAEAKEIRRQIEQSPAAPLTIRPELGVSFSNAYLTTILQSIDPKEINEKASSVGLEVGVEWEDIDHKLHHSYQCSGFNKINGSWTPFLCDNSPPDD